MAIFAFSDTTPLAPFRYWEQFRFATIHKLPANLDLYLFQKKTIKVNELNDTFLCLFLRPKNNFCIFCNAANNQAWTCWNCTKYPLSSIRPSRDVANFILFQPSIKLQFVQLGISCSAKSKCRSKLDQVYWGKVKYSDYD